MSKEACQLLWVLYFPPNVKLTFEINNQVVNFPNVVKYNGKLSRKLLCLNAINCSWVNVVTTLKNKNRFYKISPAESWVYLQTKDVSISGWSTNYELSWTPVITLWLNIRNVFPISWEYSFGYVTVKLCAITQFRKEKKISVKENSQTIQLLQNKTRYF